MTFYKKQFEWFVRVYYEDTDAGGVVFYANYLKFFERARTEWLRHLGLSQQKMKDETGGGFVVKAANIEYMAPSRLDDLLMIRSTLTQIGRASMTFKQQAWCEEKLLAQADVTVCYVDLTTVKPRPVPEEVTRYLEITPEI